jgi:S-adenosylmethionine:tRNA ribosyltransferase-isomerase
MTELNHYDYELPRELIAQHALSQRSDARMMVVRRKDASIDHAHVRDLPEYLEAPDCLVLNDTRVVAARLLGYRVNTRGRWEGLFITADDHGYWQVMCKTRGRLRVGEEIMLQDRQALDGFCLTLLANLGEGVWVARPECSGEPFQLLRQVGRVPLPPYIRGGEMQESDMERYQTVFAKRPGAIAAPTAGLHFTRELLNALLNSGVGICNLTLHVGVGTFRPIAVHQIEDHRMHREWGAIDQAAVDRLNECRHGGGRIVAVGTTCVRLLETAAQDGHLRAWQGETDLFIRPPYAFQAVDAMLTNFHLPKSTLLILVRAFGGDTLIQQAYAMAMAESYRFYSYGDAMLII